MTRAALAHKDAVYYTNAAVLRISFVLTFTPPIIMEPRIGRVSRAIVYKGSVFQVPCESVGNVNLNPKLYHSISL